MLRAPARGPLPHRPGDAEGEYRERPNYFDVTVYGAPAESVSRYLGKGGRVAIDGRLEWREWETADEQRRQAVSVVADSVQFLDSPGATRQGEESGDTDIGQEAPKDREPVGVGAADGDLAF